MKKILAAAFVMFQTEVAFAETISIDIWGDNWFSVSVNGEEVLTDPVSITTERSFNKESASFEVNLPAQIAITAKDYKENDTGLEYINTNRQQMGDGGLIAQFKNSDGTVIGVTDASAKCLVIHHSPIDVSCADESDPQEGVGACASESAAEPENWQFADFDDSAWPNAFEYTEDVVSPRFGYDEVEWDSSAKLIWSDSLLQDNTLLCRMVLQ